MKKIAICKRCLTPLSEIGIRTKPKIYCPMCKEISKMEALMAWRTKNGQ